MKRAFVSLTFLIVSLLPPRGVEVSNLFAGEGFSSGNNDPVMRIVTYNIRGCRDEAGHADPAAVAAELAGLQADIIALQEVDNGLPRSGFQHQVKRIAGMLGMNYAYGPSLNLIVGSYGNAVLSTYPIQSARMVMLPSELEPRSVLKVTLKRNGLPFDVYTTHFGLHHEERVKQSEFLAKQLREDSGTHAILAGDFNTTPDDLILDGLRTLFRDPLHERGQRLITLSGKTGGGKEIDRILLSPRLILIDAAAPRVGKSDHYPVVLTVEVPPLDRTRDPEKIGPDASGGLRMSLPSMRE